MAKKKEKKDYMTATASERAGALKERRDVLAKLQFDLRSGKLKNTASITSIRREIARILTAENSPSKTS